MKNLFVLVLLASGMMFSSCGSNLEKDLLGEWKGTLIQFLECEDDNDNISFVGDENGCAMFDGDMTCFKFSFAEGGAMSVTSTYTYGMETESDVTNGSYELDGDNITFSLDGAFSGTAEIDGDRLNIVGSVTGDFVCNFEFIMIR